MAIMQRRIKFKAHQAPAKFILLKLLSVGDCSEHTERFDGGVLMKSGIPTSSLPQGYYVLQINGQFNSMHRRFEDALKAGLLLKYQFPCDDIKVRETSSTADVMQETAFH